MSSKRKGKVYCKKNIFHLSIRKFVAQLIFIIGPSRKKFSEQVPALNYASCQGFCFAVFAKLTYQFKNGVFRILVTHFLVYAFIANNRNFFTQRSNIYQYAVSLFC